MANYLRGEVALHSKKNGGYSYRYILRPTFASIASIEASFDKSILMFLKDASARGFTLAEIEVIIRATMTEPIPNIEELIISIGILELTKKLTDLLFSGLNLDLLEEDE